MPGSDRRIRDLSGGARGMARSVSGNRSSIQRLRQYNETTMAAQGPAPARAPGRHPLCGVYACVQRVQQLKEAQVPQVPQTFFDALAVRTWCGLALEALGRAREEIDAINVYPVADGDTGTNLYLTVESAARPSRRSSPAHEAGAAPVRPPVPRRRRARDGARCAASAPAATPGTILAQLLRGMAQVFAAEGEAAHTDGAGPAACALRHAADSARAGRGPPRRGHGPDGRLGRRRRGRGAEGDCGDGRAGRLRRGRARRSPRPRGSSPSWGAPEWSTPAGGDWWRCSRRWWRRSRGRRLAAGPPALARDRRRRCPAAGRRARRRTGRRGRSESTAPTEPPPRTGRPRLRGDLPPGGRRRGRGAAAATGSTGSATRSSWSAATACGTSMCTWTTPARPWRRASRPGGRTASASPTSAPTTCTRAGAERPPARARRSARSSPSCPARAWPGCTPRPVRPPSSRAPGSRPPSGELVEAVRRAHAREVVLLPNDADLRAHRGRCGRTGPHRGHPRRPDPDPLRGPGHRRARRPRAGAPLRRGRRLDDLGRRRHPLRRGRRRRAPVLDHGRHLPGR